MCVCTSCLCRPHCPSWTNFIFFTRLGLDPEGGPWVVKIELAFWNPAHTLNQCCFNDGQPSTWSTLNQNWFNALCLLGSASAEDKMLKQCWPNAGSASQLYGSSAHDMRGHHDGHVGHTPWGGGGLEKDILSTMVIISSFFNVCIFVF